MKGIIVIMFTVLFSLNSSAQTNDSLVRYYKKRYDSVAYKLIAARVCILNVQDYLNKCKARPRNGVYIIGWTQRILDDYFQGAGITPKQLIKPKSK